MGVLGRVHHVGHHLLASFGITLPPEFATLFRALATLEGTLTTLASGYLVIEAAEAIAAEWASEHLTPDTLKELARSEILGLLPLLRRAPRHLDRIAAWSSAATCRPG